MQPTTGLSLRTCPNAPHASPSLPSLDRSFLIIWRGDTRSNYDQITDEQLGEINPFCKPYSTSISPTFNFDFGKERKRCVPWKWKRSPLTLSLCFCRVIWRTSWAVTQLLSTNLLCFSLFVLADNHLAIPKETISLDHRDCHGGNNGHHNHNN